MLSKAKVPGMTPPSQQTINLKLDPELRGRVQRLADARRRSPHWIMREAIVQRCAGAAA